MPNPMTREELLDALEEERAAIMALLPRFSAEQWHVQRADGWTAHDIAAHLADANYGLALMALGEIQPALKLNDSTGWMEVDAYNEQRRQKNAALPSEKVIDRMGKGFDHARRAMQSIEDLEAPGPYGPIHTRGQWLQRIVNHTREHRQDLEAILAGT